jgi:hypothetical protein
MGISTTFEGRFKLDHPLSPEHSAYLVRFSQTRRVKWSVELLKERADPVREAAGLPIGFEGSYFVGGESRPVWKGGDPAVLDGNQPPAGQPGLWCLWTPTKDDTAIEWNGGDKFYSYTDWLAYLIDHFLKLWGYVLNGSVRGESDELSAWSEEAQAELPCIVRSEIVVHDNVVTQKFETIWLLEDEADRDDGRDPTVNRQPFDPAKWDSLWDS